ncbi:MAG TPA: peptidoglycan-associated lipoprotein Pal [Gemmatimonadales bacterium]|nr:peptidoglycan-associated lipoprotein Pal [Gemmatimonadales bacterium]
MKRFEMLVLGGLAAVTVAAACGGGAKPTPPAPQTANVDSAAQAERARQDSLERARQDSLRRAQEEAARLAAQRTADSLAAIGRSADAVKALLATMIHFDFDKANVKSEEASILDQKVAILQANPNLKIRITGNCDERGSDEYNLALGNRRAIAAKQYLVSHGVDAGRIETASNGKEKPIDGGHTEEAWAKNRNDQTDIAAGGDSLKQP